MRLQCKCQARDFNVTYFSHTLIAYTLSYEMAQSSSNKGDPDQQFFVTRESQESSTISKKASYAGLRDLTDLEKIKELDIVGPDGTIRGIKNRVRAGLATFENRGTLIKKNTEEGKIIAYTTSFRGVRHTYEECRFVLTVFYNLRVRVSERDIYVNEFYHRELEERLGLKDVVKLPVPQVYINGQHVGGAAELEVLNETGELRELTATIPRQESSTSCPTCGGFGFIPCRKCGGSKNSVANNFTAEFRALKCTHCTENGMEPCPACEKRRAVTAEMKEENEAIKRERELRAQKEKEKIAEEKRERIKMEAMEAERQAQLEKERLKKEKERKKERARQERERKKRAAELRQKIVEDIARELEREKQWRAEREPEDSVNNEHENKEQALGESVNDAEQLEEQIEQTPTDTDKEETKTVDECEELNTGEQPQILFEEELDIHTADTGPQASDEVVGNEQWSETENETLTETAD